MELMEPIELLPVSLERMVNAVEKVRQRLLRSTGALQAAGIPYAVVGGNAVAAWVSRVDEAAVRNTQDVDILIRRRDFERTKQTLEAVGFVYGRTLDVEFFLDGPDAKVRDAVHLLMAGEKVKPEYASATPDVDLAAPQGDFRYLDLEPLVEMKLNSFRFKDRVHLLDMIAVGLIDATWPARFAPELVGRLQQLIDNPES